MSKFLRRLNYKKAAAMIVLNCFLLSFVYGPAIAEVFSAVSAQAQYAQTFSNFVLPHSYGKITDTNITSSPRLVIQIQDLHCHPEVQKNIANIIELVDKKVNNNLQAVYLEGAFGSVDTSWLAAAFPNGGKDFASRLERILQTGRLTGAEYYSALSGKYNLIKGLENEEEYLKNLKRFGNILTAQDEISAMLSGITQSTQNLKQKYYNKKHLNIENLYERFASGEVTSRKYYDLLLKHAYDLSIDTQKYANISFYITLAQKEKNLDYKETTKELQKLIFTLKEKLPFSVYKMFTDATNNFSDTDKLYEYSVSLSKEYNIDLNSNYPALSKFFDYLQTSQRINPLELIDEEQALRSEINARFSDTVAEREVIFLIGFEKYLTDYLTSKITSKDYEYYKQNIDEYKKLWVKYVDNRVLSLLEEPLRQADVFYTVNTERNKYFAKALGIKGKLAVLTDFSLRFGRSTRGAALTLEEALNNLENKKVEIVVTGGFHTEGVSEILRANNISYITVTPNVQGGLKEAEEVYYQVAKLQSAELGGGLYASATNHNTNTSAIAIEIATLDPVSRRAIIQAIETGNDLSGLVLDASVDAQKIRRINALIQGAMLLEADDTGDILQTLANIVNARLKADSVTTEELASDPELVEALVNAIENDKSIPVALEIARTDNKVLKQFKALAQSIKEKAEMLSAKPVDPEKNEKMYYSFHSKDGTEGHSVPFVCFHYGNVVADALSGLRDALKERLSAGAIKLQNPQFLHTSIFAIDDVAEQSKSPMPRALTEFLSAAVLAKIEQSVPSSVLDIEPFSAKLTGEFMLGEDGVIIYKITNKDILNKIGKKWLHITLGRLVPDKYTEQDVYEINRIVEEFNANNPLENIVYTFDAIEYGQTAGAAAGYGERRMKVISLAVRKELKDFKNSTVFFSLKGGKPQENFSINNVIAAIELLRKNHMQGYEVPLQSLRPKDRIAEGYPATAFWLKNLVGNLRKEVKTEKEVGDALVAEMEKLRDELLANALEIRAAAEGAEGMDLTAHLMAYSPFDSEMFPKDYKNSAEYNTENERLTIPEEYDPMTKIFYLNLEMAKIIGADNVVLHLNSLDNTKGYAQFVKVAAKMGITVNFENEVIYEKDKYDYFKGMAINGYASSKDFIDALSKIKTEAGDAADNMGVVFDTSKALSLRSLSPARNVELTKKQQKQLDKIAQGDFDAWGAFSAANKNGWLKDNAAQMEEDLKHIKLENLENYYKAIVAAGFKINEIHLAQFSVDTADIRAEHVGNEVYLVVYNKSVIDSQAKPNFKPGFDMIAFLQFLKAEGFDGALTQETNGGVVFPPETKQADVAVSAASSGQLTMAWLSKLLDLLHITAPGIRQSIVAAIETPLMLLSFRSPKFADRFLNKWHKGESQKRRAAWEIIKAATETALEATYRSVPFVNWCEQRVNAIYTQYTLHKEYNLNNPDDKLSAFETAGNIIDTATSMPLEAIETMRDYMYEGTISHDLGLPRRLGGDLYFKLLDMQEEVTLDREKIISILQQKALERKELISNKPSISDSRLSSYRSKVESLNEDIVYAISLMPNENEILAVLKQLQQDKLIGLKDIKYFEISVFASKRMYGKLADIINDADADIKYRLFAALQYRRLYGYDGISKESEAANKDTLVAEFKRINRLNQEEESAIEIAIENLTKDFLANYQQIERPKSDFELQAMLMGVHLALSKSLEGTFDINFKEIDQNISKAVIVGEWKGKGRGKYNVKASADASLVFDDTSFALSLEVMAHELGHNYLNALYYFSIGIETRKTFHEFFADSFAQAAGALFGINIDTSHYGKLKFKDKEIEAHNASAIMIGTAKLCLKIANKMLSAAGIDWRRIIEVCISLVKSGKLNSDDTQAELQGKFIEAFIDNAKEVFNIDISREEIEDALFGISKYNFTTFVSSFVDLLLSPFKGIVEVLKSLQIGFRGTLTLETAGAAAFPSAKAQGITGKIETLVAKILKSFPAAVRKADLKHFKATDRETGDSKTVIAKIVDGKVILTFEDGKPVDDSVKFTDEDVIEIFKMAGIKDFKDRYLAGVGNSRVEQLKQQLTFRDNINSFKELTGNHNIKINAQVQNLYGRHFVEVELDGKKVLFYRSAYGTGGKEQGTWYPIAGIQKADVNGLHWFVKGTKTELEKFHDVELFKAISDKLKNLENPDTAILEATGFDVQLTGSSTSEPVIEENENAQLELDNNNKKLELRLPAQWADKLGLKDKESGGSALQHVLRSVFIATLESPFSLLPFFVQLHYTRAGPDTSYQGRNAYNSRVTGNRLIKIMSFAGFAVLGSITMSIPFAFLGLFSFNVITHAIYNLIVTKDSRLELGSASNDRPSIFGTPDRAAMMQQAALSKLKSEGNGFFYGDNLKDGIYKDLNSADSAQDKQEKLFGKIFKEVVFDVDGKKLSLIDGLNKIFNNAEFDVDGEKLSLTALIEKLNDMPKNKIGDIQKNVTVYIKKYEYMLELLNTMLLLSASPDGNLTEMKNLLGIADKISALETVISLPYSVKVVARNVNKIMYVYGIDAKEYPYLADKIKQEYDISKLNYNSGSDMRSVDSALGAYAWVHQNLPEFFMFTDGSVASLKKLFEDYLSVKEGIDWANTEAEPYVSQAEKLAALLPEKVEMDRNMLIVRETATASPQRESTGGENGFDLIKKFGEYNRIALLELGNKNKKKPGEEIKKSTDALLNMMGVLQTLGFNNIYDEAAGRLAEAEKKGSTGAELNSIINYVHQEGLKALRGGLRDSTKNFNGGTKYNIYKMGTNGITKYEVYDYSANPLSMDIYKVFSKLSLNGETNGTFFIKDSQIIWDYGIGQHSFYTTSDFNDILTLVYNEGFRNTENAKRVVLLDLLLNQHVPGIITTNLDITTDEMFKHDDSKINEGATFLPGVIGFNAVYTATDKMKAPEEFADTFNILYAMLTDTAGLDRFLGSYSENDYRDHSSFFNGRKNTNYRQEILNELRTQYPKLPWDDMDTATENQLIIRELVRFKGTAGKDFDIGIFADHKIKQLAEERYQERIQPVKEQGKVSDETYNSLGIYDAEDKVFSEIERRFAEGRIVIGSDGKLVKNEAYDSDENLASDITAVLSGKKGNLKEAFRQADILNAVNVNNFAFRTEAVIGNMSAVSGMLSLRDGYLSVKGLLNAETNTFECAYVEFVSADGGRVFIKDSAELKNILINSGYSLAGLAQEEENTDKRINYVFKQLNTKKSLPVVRTGEIRGIPIFEGKVSGQITYKKDNTDADRILIYPKPQPHEIKGIAERCKALIGDFNKLSHSAVGTREAKLPAVSVQLVEKDGKVSVTLYKYADKAENINGFEVVRITENKQTLQEGQYIVIDGDAAYLFDLLPGWFVDKITNAVMDVLDSGDEVMLWDIINWDNTPDKKDNIAQIIGFIYSKFSGRKDFDSVRHLLNRIDKTSEGGKVVEQLETRTLSASMDSTRMKIESMSENAQALNKEGFTLKAFTVLLHAEKELSKLPKGDVRNAIAERIAALKEEIQKDVEKEALAFTRKANALLKTKVSSKNIEKTANGIHPLLSNAEVWENFYGYTGISDIVEKLRAKFEELKTKKETSSAIKALKGFSALDINDIGLKAYNYAILKNLTKGMDGFGSLNGFALSNPAIISLFGDKTYNGKTYAQLQNALEAATNQEEANRALSDLTEIVKLLTVQDWLKIIESSDDAKTMLEKSSQWAIRSSGLGEDGTTNSFAGIAETELGIKGSPQEMIEAVKHVLTSFFKQGSADYVEGKGAYVLPSIFVQEMVQDVHSAGQIFTADNAGNTEIEGVFGLGEGSVSGRVAADYIIFKVGDNIVLYRKADERIMKIVSNPDGGTMQLPLTDEEKNLEVFAAETVEKLLAFSQKAEKHFGYPLDMEFAVTMENGCPVIYPLQARTITVFTEKGYKLDENDKLELSSAASSGQLTMSWLSKLLDILHITSPGIRQSIVAAVETPLILLSFMSPKVADSFLNKWHDGESQIRRAGFESIKAATEAAWKATYSSIPFLNLYKKIVNAISTQFKLHKEYNLNNKYFKVKDKQTGVSKIVIAKKVDGKVILMFDDGKPIDDSIRFTNKQLIEIFEWAGIKNFDKQYLIGSGDTSAEVFKEYFNFLDDADRLKKLTGNHNIKINAQVQNVYGRHIVEIEFDGKKMLFYRSFKGTDGKVQGTWYPLIGISKVSGFFRKGLHWLVKDEGIFNFYDVELFKAISAQLKSLENPDTAILEATEFDVQLTSSPTSEPTSAAQDAGIIQPAVETAVNTANPVAPVLAVQKAAVEIVSDSAESMGDENAENIFTSFKEAIEKEIVLPDGEKTNLVKLQEDGRTTEALKVFNANRNEYERIATDIREKLEDGSVKFTAQQEAKLKQYADYENIILETIKIQNDNVYAIQAATVIDEAGNVKSKFVEDMIAWVNNFDGIKDRLKTEGKKGKALEAAKELAKAMGVTINKKDGTVTGFNETIINQMKAIALETNRRIASRDGYLRFSDDQEKKEETERYNRVKEGVAQFLTRSLYGDDNIIVNTWSYSGTDEEKKAADTTTANIFASKYFINVVKELQTAKYSTEGLTDEEKKAVESAMTAIKSYNADYKITRENADAKFKELSALLKALLNASNDGMDIFGTNLQSKVLVYSGAPGTGKDYISSKVFDAKEDGNSADMFDTESVMHTLHSREIRWKDGEYSGQKYQFFTPEELIELANDPKYKDIIEIVFVNGQPHGMVVVDKYLIPVPYKIGHPGYKPLNDEEKAIVDAARERGETEIIIYREVKGIDALFAKHKLFSKLEGGLGTMLAIQDKYPSVTTLFISPYTNEEIKQVGKNNEWIVSTFTTAERLRLANEFMQALTVENEGVIDLTDADTQQKLIDLVNAAEIMAKQATVSAGAVSATAIVGSAAVIAKEAANPVAPVLAAQNAAVEIVSNGAQKQEAELQQEGLSLKDCLIIAKTEEQAAQMRAKGLNAVVRVREESEEREENKTVYRGKADARLSNDDKVYIDIDAGKIEFVLSKGYTISDAIAEFKNLVQEGFKLGRNVNKFEGIKDVIEAVNEADAENTLRNERTFAAGQNTSFDLSALRAGTNIAEEVSRVLSMEDIDAFVITPAQYADNKASIYAMRQKGIKFVLSVTDKEFYDKGIMLDGLQINATSGMNLAGARNLLEAVKANAARHIGARISIEFSEDVISGLKTDVYKEYKIMPLISANSNYAYGAEIRVKTAAEYDRAIKDEKSNMALNISDTSIVSLKSKETKDVNAEAGYDKGYRSGLTSESNFTVNSVEGLADLLSLGVTADVETIRQAAGLLGQETLSHVEYLLNKGDVARAAGFIRAAAMNTVREEIISILEANKISVNKENLLKSELFQKEFLTLALKLKLSGEDLGAILSQKLETSSTMSAMEYLDALALQITRGMEDISVGDEYKVTAIENADMLQRAVELFKMFNVLMQDRFRETGITEDLRISSTIAVRNILSAA
jgi:hypothetical protein